MKVPPPLYEGAAFACRRCRLRLPKVPPPPAEGAASEGRRYGLRGQDVPPSLRGGVSLLNQPKFLLKALHFRMNLLPLKCIFKL